jgi:hypothetical protein
MRRGTWLSSGWRALLLLYVLLFVPLFRPDVGVNDPAGYYAWARSVLVDGDLDLTNEFTVYGMNDLVPRTPSGSAHDQWAAGSAWLWLPAMALAHAVLKVGGWSSVPADGYSWPYVWAAALTTTLSGLGAILLVYHLAQRLFSAFAALLSALAIWLATPLVFYQFHQPLLAHANDALLNALFIWCWWQVRQNGDKPIGWLRLGLVIGAATWVRTQNILLLLATIVEQMVIQRWPLAREATAPRFALVRNCLWLLTGLAFTVIPLSIFWHSIYGAWIVNTYQASGGGVFDWRASHWWQVLSSSDRGMLVWTPITCLALVGFYPLWRADRRLATLLGSVVLVQWYVISCWSHWSGGHAFGPRLWTAVLPAFGLSLAALIDRLDGGRWAPRWAIRSVITLFVVWNFLLMLQYSLGRVAPSGEVDLVQVAKQQFALAPELFVQLMARIQRMWHAL